MLPDLWRMADRRVRPAREAVRTRDGGERVLDEVLAGVGHHVALDRWFHASSFFLEGERLTADRLGALAIPRARLLAHVTWELCLDGALLGRAGFAGELARLRVGLEDAHPRATNDAVGLHHFERVERAAGAREVVIQRLDRIASELAKGPWIEGYQTGAGVAFRLDGVRRAVGLDPMNEGDRAALARVLDDLLAIAREQVVGLLAEAPPWRPTGSP